MADSNLMALNSTYGISTVQNSNAYLKSDNQSVIALAQQGYQLSVDVSTGKSQVLLTDYTDTPQTYGSVQTAQAKFIGYIQQDYDVNSLQKKAGNYWIVQTTKAILFYTGIEFIKYDNSSSVIRKYKFIDDGTADQPHVKYSSDAGYQLIRTSIQADSDIQIYFKGDLFSLGNVRDHSLQFSFEDQDNYKQIRLFDSTENYRTQYYVQSKSNYTELDSLN